MYNGELIVNGELVIGGLLDTDTIDNIRDMIKENITLRDYFNYYGSIYEEDINGLYNVFIQIVNETTENEYLCIELTDKSGNSVNIGLFTIIDYDTKIKDIKKHILNGVCNYVLTKGC